MRRRAVRITPLGYIVLSIIILVMLVGIYFIVWSMRNSDGNEAAVQSPTNASAGMTPTPSLAPISAANTQAPVAESTPQVTKAPASTTAAAAKKAAASPEKLKVEKPAAKRVRPIKTKPEKD